MPSGWPCGFFRRAGSHGSTAGRDVRRHVCGPVFPRIPAPGPNNVKNFTNFSCGRGARLLNNALNFAVGMPVKPFVGFLIFLQQ
jgi:hypothetical protein